MLVRAGQQGQQPFAGRSQSCSPLKRFKPSGNAEAAEADGVDPSTGTHVDSDDAELARKLHEQLNGPDSPTAAPITRHITRVRRAPTFYKPEVLLACHCLCVIICSLVSLMLCYWLLRFQQQVITFLMCNTSSFLFTHSHP